MVINKKLVRKVTVRLMAFAVALIAVAILAPKMASAATLTPGDLVKLPDDSNQSTTADSAVYYHGSDGKRYVFPNAQTYFTWYADFSQVKVIDSAQMASLSIGGNVTYRPGTRLVKITSDPKVYAVEPGGILRPIDSEGIANTLYGSQWNQRIDDVPDAFFFNYTIGSPLTAAVYPDGSVVKRESDGVIFRIENRSKRQISSMDVLQALRVQDQFILVDNTDLSSYLDGSGISTAEVSITDTSQKNLSQIASIPTFTLVPPASLFAAVGGDTTFMELKISSVKAARVQSIKVRLDGVSSGDTPGPEDYDVGGLIYENNAQANITKIRFVDDTGAEPFGRKELVVDVNQDQSQTFIFNGSFNLPAGMVRTLYLKGQFNTVLPTGQVYKATLLIDGVGVVDTASGQATSFSPTVDIVGSQLSTLNATMDVSSYPAPSGQTVVRGVAGVAISGFAFKATKEAPNVINRIKIQGYIDEEGTSGFLPGGDSDNGSLTEVRQLVPRVYLYNGDTLLAGPSNVDLNGQATFSGLGFHIPAGNTANLTIKGDTNISVQLEMEDDRVSFDIINSRTDVDVTDDVGGLVTAVGEFPNGGTEPVAYLTVTDRGEIDFKWQGGGGPIIVGRDLEIGTLIIEPEYDTYELRTIVFSIDSYPVSSFPGPITLNYTDMTGSPASTTAQLIGSTATFNNLSALVDKNVEIKLSGRVVGRNAGAVYSENINIRFAPEAGLHFISRTDGSDFEYPDLDNDKMKISTNTTSSWVTRYSGLTGAISSNSPTQVWMSYPQELLRFTIKAEPEGAVRVKKMVFKLTPNDPGSYSEDILEYWAKQHQSILEDDGFSELEWVGVGDYRQLLGESSTGSIRYYPKTSSGSDVSDPDNYYSASSDYAIVEYILSDNQEWTVPAGVTHEFSFQVDMSRFIVTEDQSNTIKVELLGESNFLWTDIPSGAYTAMEGGDALGGIPISKTPDVN